MLIERLAVRRSVKAAGREHSVPPPQSGSTAAHDA
jgi:hypothetical protein